MRSKLFRHCPLLVVTTLLIGVNLEMVLPDVLAAAAAGSRADAARARVLPGLRTQLAAHQVQPGDPLLIRIFKQERTLEVWMQARGEKFRRVLEYPICAYSGALGPKTRQGDGQAPEGFYRVDKHQLNPASSYHLSFNLGYPNAYERAQAWTGDYLMVHGNCVSIGCYAMGDAAIEEIYTLVAAALDAGQDAVPVHTFPFHLDAAHEAQRLASPHADFWGQLAEGYRAFEASGEPPRISVRGGRYRAQARN